MAAVAAGCWQRERDARCSVCRGQCGASLPCNKVLVLRGSCVEPPLHPLFQKQDYTALVLLGAFTLLLSLSHLEALLEPHTLPVPHTGPGAAAAWTRVCCGHTCLHLPLYL